MPNTGHYIVCPYYMADKNKSIHCEDARRRFNRLNKKQEWMKHFCDDAWADCPFAKALNEIYERMDDDDMSELEKHKVAEQEKENRKLASQIGKLEKAVADKNEDIKRLRERNRKLEAHYQDLLKDHKKKTMEIEKIKREGKKQSDEFIKEATAVVDEYTERVSGIIAYLMHIHHESSVNEKDVAAWKENHDFLVVKHRDDDGNRFYTLEERKEVIQNGLPL